jgi:hypothetical protein
MPLYSKSGSVEQVYHNLQNLRLELITIRHLQEGSHLLYLVQIRSSLQSIDCASFIGPSLVSIERSEPGGFGFGGTPIQRFALSS